MMNERIRKLAEQAGGEFYEGSYIAGHVEEGMVTEEIEEDLKKLGWQVLADKNTNF